MIGRKNLFFTLLLFFCFNLNAQSTYLANEMIIKFTDTSGPSDLANYFNQIDATPKGVLNDGITYNYSIGGTFPKVIYDNGSFFVFFDIIDILGHTLGKSKVDDGGLNYEIDIPSFVDNGSLPSSGLIALSNCSNYPGSFPANVGGTTSIKIGIVDTGVEESVINSNFSVPISDIIDITSPVGTGEDANGHGTRVTSVVADVVSYMGASNASIVMVKAFKGSTGLLFEYMQALEELKDERVNIINMSFGFSPDPDDRHSESFFEGFLSFLEDHNILAIVSAGNDGLDLNNDTYLPATASGSTNIISVASSNCDGDLSSFSNYGTNPIDLVAPGENITTVLPSGEWSYSYGTSFSTPFVSALAAIYASNLQEFDIPKIICKIKSSVISKTNLAPYVETSGMLNYDNSVCNTSGLSIADNVTFNTTDYEEALFYPNPFSGNLSIEIMSNTSEELVLEVFDGTGKIISRQSVVVEKGHNQFNVLNSNNWPAGIYFGKVLDAEASLIVTQKLVKR